MDAEVRKGDNLFSCSVVALNPDTGARKWHYQFTPNDSHDWDANQDLILLNRGTQKLLVQTNRNGIFYVLDRSNGKLLLGKPYVSQTWNDGFHPDGRPIVRPGSDSTPEGRVVAPSLVGGTNWQSPSYDPKTGWMYVVYADAPQRYLREPSVYEPGKAFWGGRSLPTGDPVLTGIKAIDTVTGDVKWDYKLSRGSLAAGVLATSTGVLFAATAEGNLIALNSKTAQPLWTMQTGGPIASSPMSYAVDGKQFVAVSASGVLFSFGLPE
jgi:alcohol dehydrogenase (cytochrome c)